MPTNPFRPTYRELTDDEKKLVDDIKEKAFDLYLQYLDVIPEGERSDKGRMVALAKTKLEESVMWAVKAVTG